LEDDEDEKYMVEELQVSSVCDTKQSSKEYIVSLSVKGQKIEFKCDFGAQVNVLSLKRCIKLDINSKDLIIKTKSVITSFTKNRLPVVGKCKLQCRYKNIDCLIEFYVVDIDCFNILGLKTSEKLGFIIRVETVSKDGDC